MAPLANSTAPPNQERWRKINSAFSAVLAIGAGQRECALDELCGGDPALHEEVRSLIAAHEGAGAFGDQSLFEPDDSSATVPALEGRRLGAYTLLRKIGDGGMGAVYLAARSDEQYEKQVAIKIIKNAQYTESDIRRFRHERQLLANLDHPNIARLIDGGTSDEGMPYLVMEYVRGETIDRYCDAHRLSIDERLNLFQAVCSAVGHAHQNFIIHRDLKPSNILITPNGEPKLLDFGIAKLLQNGSATQFPAPTTTVWPAMTPDYASPEQVRGETVTAAADVYSLGVLLYELLAGRHPYRCKGRLPHEVLYAICAEDPAKPSAIIDYLLQEGGGSSLEATRRTPRVIAEARRERPDTLRRRLAGGLDSIILMSMRKEPARRYASVDEFVEDIKRHRRGSTIVARHDTVMDRAIKLIQRHPWGSAAILLVTVSLAVGILTAQWKARLATIERVHTVFKAPLTERGLRINTCSIAFAAGNADLSPEARECLAEIAGFVLAYGDLRLQIEGHTDITGGQSYNDDVSTQRAEAVKNFLIAKGIPPERVLASGFGATRPFDSNGTEIGRRRNRRVDVLVVVDGLGDRIGLHRGSHEQGSSPAPSIRIMPAPGRTRGAVNAADLALYKRAMSSAPCRMNEGPEKAVNGGVSRGLGDKWCSLAHPAVLLVDLGASFPIGRFVVKHAGAGGEPGVLNTSDFSIQTSVDGSRFVTVVDVRDNAVSTTTHLIPTTTARFVRLIVTMPSRHWINPAARIYELEVYSPANSVVLLPARSAPPRAAFPRGSKQRTRLTQAAPTGWTPGLNPVSWTG